MNNIIFEKEINYEVYNSNKKQGNQFLLTKIYKITKNNENLYFFEITDKLDNFFSFNKLINKEEYLIVKEKLNINVPFEEFEVFINNLFLNLNDENERIIIKLKLFDDDILIEILEHIQLKNKCIILFQILLNKTSDEIKRKIINQKFEQINKELTVDEEHFLKIKEELYNNYPAMYNELVKLKLI